MRGREKVIEVKKQDSVFFEGYQIDHNHMMEYVTSNTTPSQACSIEARQDKEFGYENIDQKKTNAK